MEMTMTMTTTPTTPESLCFLLFHHCSISIMCLDSLFSFDTSNKRFNLLQNFSVFSIRRSHCAYVCVFVCCWCVRFLWMNCDCIEMVRWETKYALNTHGELSLSLYLTAQTHYTSTYASTCQWVCARLCLYNTPSNLPAISPFPSPTLSLIIHPRMHNTPGKNFNCMCQILSLSVWFISSRYLWSWSASIACLACIYKWMQMYLNKV